MISERTARGLVPWTLAPLIVGMFLGAAGYALARPLPLSTVAKRAPLGFAPERTRLPREWRWSPPVVDLEDMYREKTR